jgi:hypothetical protein
MAEIILRAFERFKRISVKKITVYSFWGLFVFQMGEFVPKEDLNGRIFLEKGRIFLKKGRTCPKNGKI